MLQIYQLWEEAKNKVCETAESYYLGRETAFHECIGILLNQEKEEAEEIRKFEMGLAYKPKEEE